MARWQIRAHHAGEPGARSAGDRPSQVPRRSIPSRFLRGCRRKKFSRMDERHTWRETARASAPGCLWAAVPRSRRRAFWFRRCGREGPRPSKQQVIASEEALRAMIRFCPHLLRGAIRALGVQDVTRHPQASRSVRVMTTSRRSLASSGSSVLAPCRSAASRHRLRSTRASRSPCTTLRALASV